MKKISKAVVRRLPKYYRYLSYLAERGEERISSAELSEITGFTASQIRQDLNHFGGFGQQGFGYRVSALRDQVAAIIGLESRQRLGIVGIGHLGEAIANSNLFTNDDYELIALFDADPNKVGTSFSGHTIHSVADLERIIREETLDILIITTPSAVAQELADRAGRAGIKGIWNFALYDIHLPEGVVLENVYLEESLHTLTYYIHHPDHYQGA